MTQEQYYWYVKRPTLLRLRFAAMSSIPKPRIVSFGFLNTNILQKWRPVNVKFADVLWTQPNSGTVKMIWTDNSSIQHIENITVSSVSDNGKTISLSIPLLLEDDIPVDSQLTFRFLINGITLEVVKTLSAKLPLVQSTDGAVKIFDVSPTISNATTGSDPILGSNAELGWTLMGENLTWSAEHGNGITEVSVEFKDQNNNLIHRVLEISSVGNTSTTVYLSEGENKLTGVTPGYYDATIIAKRDKNGNIETLTYSPLKIRVVAGTF